jgi:hypothetical protein
MKPNMSQVDRYVRILFSLIVAVLYFTNVLTGTIGLVLLIIGGVLLATAFLNFCPLYGLLGIRTNKKND